MDIDQLRTFCHVVDEQSFSRAARAMFLTQPAISMQIKSLEQEIGQSLFDRGRKKIVPTEAGTILYGHVQAICHELASARIEMDQIKQLVRGRLIIGCSDTVSSYILPPLLSSFLKQFPELSITVQNRPSLDITRMVIEGAADIGFVTLPVQAKQCIIWPFVSYHDVAVCALDHACAARNRISLPVLAQQRLLLLEPGTKSRMLLDEAFARCGLVPVSIMGFGSVEVQKAFARKGIGIAIVPDFAVENETGKSALKVVPIQGISQREIGIIVRKNRTQSLASQRFLASIIRNETV
jgi:DNA-binding transcriptional LysR family regulator